MATVEVVTLEGKVTTVSKEPREYFAEWRARLERSRDRREEMGLGAWTVRTAFLPREAATNGVGRSIGPPGAAWRVWRARVAEVEAQDPRDDPADHSCTDRPNGDCRQGETGDPP